MDELIRAMSAFEGGVADAKVDPHVQKIANFLCKVWNTCTCIRSDNSRCAATRLLGATGLSEVERIMSIYAEGEITKNFAARDRAVRYHIDILKLLLKKVGVDIQIA